MLGNIISDFYTLRAGAMRYMQMSLPTIILQSNLNRERTNPIRHTNVVIGGDYDYIHRSRFET